MLYTYPSYFSIFCHIFNIILQEVAYKVIAATQFSLELVEWEEHMQISEFVYLFVLNKNKPFLLPIIPLVVDFHLTSMGQPP